MTEILGGINYTEMGKSLNSDKLDNLDIPLSSRASENTLNNIKIQTDKLTYNPDNYLKIVLSSDEVGIAKSSDISSDQPRHITNAFDIINDRFKIDAQNVANPSNLDTTLSTRASESTLSSINGKIDGILKTTDLDIDINKILGVKIENDNIGIAKEITLNAIKGSLFSVGTDKIITIPDNPSNLDTTLSTRASELTLSNIYSKIPISEESFTFPQITTIGISTIWEMVNSFKDFTIIINNDAIDTAPQIDIEGSIDNDIWFCLESSNVIGIDPIHLINTPIKYLRLNIISLGDGSIIDCNILGVK